jgi:chemotaxis protein MotA
MSRFDLISLIGLVVSLIAIVGGQALEGGHLSSILQMTALLIVIGGTAGAVMLQSSPRIFVEGMKMAGWIFQPPPVDVEARIHMIIGWSATARRGGLLALEPQIEDMTDPFTRKGLQMLVDGAEPEMLRDALDLELHARTEHQRTAAKIWEGAGGYAPTIGILGAVLGLIHVMENLSDPSKLGEGIAVAFVATIYGVGSANLIFLPMAKKLLYIVQQQAVLKEMLIEGLVAIANGENPRVVETKLRGFVV